MRQLKRVSVSSVVTLFGTAGLVLALSACSSGTKEVAPPAEQDTAEVAEEVTADLEEQQAAVDGGSATITI